MQTNNTPNASKNSTPPNQSPVTQTKNIRNWNPSLCKDFLYTSNGHEVRINKYVGRGGHVIIPDYIDGNPVTSIAAEAFYGFESGKNVTGVELPCKLQYICSNAFAHMRNLKGIITLPQALQKIHDSAFSCTGINGLVIQSNCKIQYCAFYSNENLDFVYITEGCSPRIDSDAFSDNKHLKTVIIPRETTRIEERAFKLCNAQ